MPLRSPNQKPLLALCPIGKFVFSHEDAIRHKQLIQKKLSDLNVSFVDLEGVLPDGIVRSQEHVKAVVEHFKGKDIDALFLPHCNFGTEGAAMIARELGVPALLWGPRDEAPLSDGTRLRDSLCGLFATSRVFRTLGVPFTYIENCRIDDKTFVQGLDAFLRASNVARLFRRGMRIGHVGQRIDFFWSTIVNEAELLEKFKVEVLPLDMVECIRHVRDRAVRNASGYREELANWRTKAVIEDTGDEQFILLLALRDQLMAYVADHGLDALAVQDFSSLSNALGVYDFFTVSLVAEHVPFGLESDIHGAITCAMLRRAALDKEPTFLADVTARHPTDDNGVLLWHAGAPPSMLRPGSEIRVGRHWILPSPVGGMPHFPLKDGHITVARFDGCRGEYQLVVGEADAIAGPHTLNNYLWAKVKDWPAWERILIEGPFIHHMGMAYGSYANALNEACKYVPGLRPVPLP